MGIEVLREEVTLRQQLGDPVRLGAALNNLGNLMFDVGDYQGAEPVLDAAISAFREAGENPSLILSSLAAGALHEGRYDECELRSREALQESRMVDDAYGIAVAMGVLGRCLALNDGLDDARTQLVEARERFEELNVTPGVADVDVALALVERAEGSLRESARRLFTALTAAGQTWDDDADYLIAQLAASMIDDLPTAVLLISAAATRYERSDVAPALWVVRDLEQTTRRLEQELGAEDFGRCHRAGARRTRAEILQATTDGLEAFVDRFEAHTDDPGNADVS
jgi:tetratricopeptide (TPR) repeat protein